ncbi:hypothetical protein N0V90_009986 [Kalmusia sp. IMI 367209]|nr:hypothetical protein N0V90_009986 [Kalmusia sp. IMI 367209]
MQPLSIFTVQAILAFTTIAQNTVADIWVYSTSKCSGDAFSASSHLEVYESNKVLSGGTWECRYRHQDLVGFEDSGTAYTVFVDETTIPDDCSLVLYTGTDPNDALASGKCMNYYSTIGNKDGGCVETSIAHQFGYALCCGDNCQAATKPPSTPSLLKREIEEVMFPASAVRDITAVKPDVTYEASTTNTFGVSAEAGVNLFEVISASVTFSYEVSHETSRSYSWSISADVPPGQSGYISFAPHYLCSPEGKFSGSQCQGAPVDTPGRFCYQALLSGNPDGKAIFVQEVS